MKGNGMQYNNRKRRLMGVRAPKLESKTNRHKIRNTEGKYEAKLSTTKKKRAKDFLKRRKKISSENMTRKPRKRHRKVSDTAHPKKRNLSSSPAATSNQWRIPCLKQP
jgi:hypothetical protein